MFKNIHRWLGSYCRQQIGKVRPMRRAKPVHIMFCCADHFEPEGGGADTQTQLQRIRRWIDEYPKLVDRHRDANGQHPKHSFFYPAEVYNPEHLQLLADFCKRGYAEVEIHLHHDGDTSASLTAKLEKAKKDFATHNLLSRKRLSGRLHYGFIHGNWALNNSRKDGKWCGVNNELHVLKETGCYADFTFPSAPSETQPRKINSIYYASSTPEKSFAHNKGKISEVGVAHKADLLLIQGPLALNWRSRRSGIFPRIENGDLCATNPPTRLRVDLWIKQNIHVKGKPEWIFVKVHTHGCQEKNADVLLGKAMDETYDYLESKYNDGKNYRLHYVTARQMYNVIKAAEAGEAGDPGRYLDYVMLSQLH